MQHDAPADRAAHDGGLVEFECRGDFEDHAHIIARSEPVLLIFPADWRRGLSVPRHVEHDHAIVFRDAPIVQQAAILPTVGACSVQAKQGNAVAGFLDIETVRPPEQVEMQIAADGWLETRAHAVASPRSTASTPLK